MAETVLVGLGANLGDPLRALRDALVELRRQRPGLRASSAWASAPVDCPPGSPDFVNAVAVFPAPPELDPHACLALLQAMESAAGRQRGVRNAPRTLDLDLLCFGDRLLDSPALTLPHPRAHLRAFVLRPAAEIAPEMIWPGTDARIDELARDVDGAGLRRLPDALGPHAAFTATD